jgi:hypothetical protein
MDKMDHLMAEKNENIKDSHKGQVTPKKYLKKVVPHSIRKMNNKKQRQQQAAIFVAHKLT